MFELNQQNVLDRLAAQDVVLGLFLVGAGLIFMLMGVRIARALIALSAAIIGFVLVGATSLPPAWQLIAGVVAAAGLAVLALFLFKVGVAVLAGSWTGTLAGWTLNTFGAGEQTCLLVAVCSFAIAFSLAFIMFEEIIAFVTSLEGTLLVIAGLVVFLSKSPQLYANFRNMLTTTFFFMPFLVLAGTVTGFYFQLGEMRKKAVGRSG